MLYTLPNTMAKVLVAFRSFFADDFSRFFFDALCTLYIVNLEQNKMTTIKKKVKKKCIEV